MAAKKKTTATAKATSTASPVAPRETQPVTEVPDEKQHTVTLQENQTVEVKRSASKPVVVDETLKKSDPHYGLVKDPFPGSVKDDVTGWYGLPD